jgi:beta-fructofuranosidase
LYHWINQPIAIFPPANDTFVFSGSAVIDVNNTSGFFPTQNNGVVAIYTLAQYPNNQAGPQQQAIAYSRDGGYTFTPYEKNPVIPSTSSQFRDPKVIWYNDHWVMVIAYAIDFTIGFYTSPDLKSWTHASNFSHHGLLGLQYECPNLVEMPIRQSDGSSSSTAWLLQISINPGAPLGGSIAEYFPGHFNGTHFTTYDAAARIADFGKDNYAAQFFYGTGSSGVDAVSMGWASNWQYSQVVPTGNLEGWRSSMSIPRRNYLANATRIGPVMVSEPYGIDAVLGDTLASKSSLGNGTVSVDYSGVASNAVWLVVNATNVNASLFTQYSTLNFTFSSPVSNESVSGGQYFAGDSHFFLNRGAVLGFDNPFFTDKVSTTEIIGTSWVLQVLIDRSIIEVFLENGWRSATQTFFPKQPLTQLTVSAGAIPAGMKLSVEVKAIKSAWAREADESGLVVGNVTATGQMKSKRGVRYMANFE